MDGIAAAIIIVALCVLMGFVCWLSSQADQAENVPVSTVEVQQRYLNSLGNPRYNCGEVDGKAGEKFCRALNNWSLDQYAKEIIKKMEQEK